MRRRRTNRASVRVQVVVTWLIKAMTMIVRLLHRPHLRGSDPGSNSSNKRLLLLRKKKPRNRGGSSPRSRSVVVTNNLLQKPSRSSKILKTKLLTRTLLGDSISNNSVGNRKLYILERQLSRENPQIASVEILRLPRKKLRSRTRHIDLKFSHFLNVWILRRSKSRRMTASIN